MINCEYVLITPARNEQDMIGRTIHAVASQTVRPKRWVIVDDGSTDRTRQIIDDASHLYPFIIPVYTAPNRDRNFGSKAAAFSAGYAVVKSESFDFLGNVDADVTFEASYYEQIIAAFKADQSLGIAGGLIYELLGRKWRRQRNSANSVAGAIQFFRRKCYECIGGYIPMPDGGIDAAAEIMARARGWKVTTFPQLAVYHHRRVATGKNTVLSTRFGEGSTNYLLGYHPAFQLASSLSRCTSRPIMLGSLATLVGYGWSWLRGQKVALSPEAVSYLRSEQIARLRMRGGGFKVDSRGC